MQDTQTMTDYDRGWHDALASLREQTIDQLDPGQVVTREQILSAIDVTDE
jgi:hypothetical protein